MSSYELVPELINIVLLNVDYFESSDEFNRKFKTLINNQELSIEESKIDVNIEGIPDDNERLQKFIEVKAIRSLPIKEFKDNDKEIGIQYSHAEENSKLLIEVNKSEKINDSAFEAITQYADILTDEFQSHFKGIGFNFFYSAKTSDEDNFISNNINNLENEFQEIKDFNLHFRFYQDEDDLNKKHLIAVEVTRLKNNGDKSFIIKVNFHYENFKTVRGKGKKASIIRDEIIPNMKNNFDRAEEIIKTLLSNNLIKKGE